MWTESAIRESQEEAKKYISEHGGTEEARIMFSLNTSIDCVLETLHRERFGKLSKDEQISKVKENK